MVRHREHFGSRGESDVAGGVLGAVVEDEYGRSRQDIPDFTNNAPNGVLLVERGNDDQGFAGAACPFHRAATCRAEMECDFNNRAYCFGFMRAWRRTSRRWLNNRGSDASTCRFAREDDPRQLEMPAPEFENSPAFPDPRVMYTACQK